MSVTTCVFDAYGTLFDVSAAARKVAAEPGREGFASYWPVIAERWRQKQLGYSWLRAITGHYIDFWQVTQDGLDWALESCNLTRDPDVRARLLQLYWELESYSEVPAMLQILKDNGFATAILSNGSPDMLNGAVQSANISSLLDAVLSVEQVKIFKPAPQVYDLVGQHFGCTRNQVLFVSSNGWDAGAAAAYGFRTAWVNRGNEPVDYLPARPEHILSDLTGIPNLVGV